MASKTLHLILKKKYFDEILNGEKLDEIREIRPKTASKYCDFDKDGVLVGAKQYDAIMFYLGYETNRPSMLVEVKSAEITLFDDEDTGEPLTYVENGIEYIEAEIKYKLGRIIDKHNC